MQKARDIIGLPVIEVDNGKKWSTVKDILFDNQWVMQGLLLESKHWFSSPKYVAWDDILSIGPDAVTIPNESVLRTLEDETGMNLLFGGKNKIFGLPIVTVNGHMLGNLEDVYIDGKLGRKVIGYELTDGLISDLREGRKWIPHTDGVTVGEDTIIVPVQAAHELAETEQFFQG